MNIAKQAKEASVKLRSLNKKQREEILSKIADVLIAREAEIIAANKKDLIKAEQSSLSLAIQDRLKLDPKRIQAMAKAVKEIAAQPEVLGEISNAFTRNDGLKVMQERVPLGVILMIFESRPNVVVDAAALAVKSGNAIILKGGKEAYYSNLLLGEIIKKASNLLPEHSVQVLASDDREVVTGLLSQNEYIDVVIPRGGESLIKFVYAKSSIPIIAHFRGLCHIFVDQEANLEAAEKIILNAKIQRPGVCNALETLLVHKKHEKKFLLKIIAKLEQAGCKVNLNKPEFFDTEYLASEISVCVVEDLNQAISHINQHGSFHTEGIISDNQDNIKKFRQTVDASCIVVNASTRFNDGGELGLGAEIGISTTKLHAYGPMGAKELTTKRFVVVGDGHLRN